MVSTAPLIFDKEILDEIDLMKWIAENLPIRFLGDPVLKQKCKLVKEAEFGSQEITNIGKIMVETLRKYRTKSGLGRGLAANQIGFLKRMIVVWLGNEPEVFINPEIIKLAGKGSYWESCISTGSLLIGEVIRPWKGNFKYKTLEGEEKILEADEKQTRLFLHEMDHLNGEVCTEHYQPGTCRFVRLGKKEVLLYPFLEIKI